jgi:hypothetical protein
MECGQRVGFKDHSSQPKPKAGPSMDAKPDGLLNLFEAMNYLQAFGGVQLLSLIQSGEVSVVRVQGKPAILVDEIEEFIARQSVSNDRR